MKKNLARAGAALALTVTVAGCVGPPPGGYPSASYYPPPQTDYSAPQSGYVPPQTGYVAPQPDYDTDQYGYADGQPYAVVGGQQYVVLFDPGLGWGYYDGYRRWHGAPPRWRDDFDRRFPGGRGYAPGARREPEFRREESFQGRPGGDPNGFRRAPELQRDQGFQGHAGSPPAGFARPEGPARAERAPPTVAPTPQAGRPAGPAPATRVSAPAPQPAPPPQRAEPPHVRAGCGTPSQPHC